MRSGLGFGFRFGLGSVAKGADTHLDPDDVVRVEATEVTRLEHGHRVVAQVAVGRGDRHLVGVRVRVRVRVWV